MAIGDSEEKILSDLQHIVVRAIALGRRLEKDEVRDRIRNAIDGTTEGPATVAETTTFATAPRPMPSTERRKYPYGHVKRTVSRVILERRSAGISREQIGPVCAEDFDTYLHEGGIQTALKTLSEEGLVKYSAAKNAWFPTHKLIESAEPQTAPEQEAQGRFVS